MLEQYFQAKCALVHTRPGAAGPFLGEFAAALEGEGYAFSTVGSYLRAAAHLGAWMDDKGLAIPNLDDMVVGRFINHLAGCSCVKPRGYLGLKNKETRAGARGFLAYLRHRGIVPPATLPEMALPELVSGFEHWMSQHRGVMASTLDQYRPTILGLVEEAGNPAHFTVDGLRRFVAERAVLFGPEHGRAILSRVRMFLRFLAGQGQCDLSLVGAIPAIAHWRLASLPAYLAPGEVERIISAPDHTKPIGLRDRAILLLLARIGLRAGDVVHLRLEDIDWATGTFAINGKERRPGRLPLPQDVGDAILNYLAGGRPPTRAEQVFVRAYPPFGPLLDSSSISDIVGFAAQRAGVVLPPGHRAHALRHSLATGLVRSGVPFPVIQTVLRHRSGDTTASYAKVDVPSLRKIAQPWPLGVGPC